MTRTVFIVPCFNEERRLDSEGFFAFGAESVDLLFVDDGSTDGTRALLDSLCRQLRAHGVPAQVLPLARVKSRSGLPPVRTCGVPSVPLAVML